MSPSTRFFINSEKSILNSPAIKNMYAQNKGMELSISKTISKWNQSQKEEMELFWFSNKGSNNFEDHLLEMIIQNKFK